MGWILSYKKHYTTSAIDKSVSDAGESYTRGADTMDKQDLFAILGTELVDADGSILEENQQV